jgi:hypothetical protein
LGERDEARVGAQVVGRGGDRGRATGGDAECRAPAAHQPGPGEDVPGAEADHHRADGDRRERAQGLRDVVDRLRDLRCPAGQRGDEDPGKQRGEQERGGHPTLSARNPAPYPGGDDAPPSQGDVPVRRLVRLR